MAVQLYGVSNKTIDLLPRRFERKYYLTPQNVGMAYGLLRQVCLPASEYASEQINSLYFDTFDLDQHERSSSGDSQKDKVRIRWYGKDEDFKGNQTIFIELKSKQAFASTKQRKKMLVPAVKLAPDHIGQGIVPRTLLSETLAEFGYFPPGMLQPVIKISYWRYRFSEIITGQSLSLDCHIRSTMTIPGPGNGQKDLELSGSVIEIKGQSMELPITLRRTRILDTDWSRLSKYSACIDSHTEGPGTVGWLSPSGRLVEL